MTKGQSATSSNLIGGAGKPNPFSRDREEVNIKAAILSYILSTLAIYWASLENTSCWLC